MRVLIGPTADGPPDLDALYAAPQASWLRVNMVATVDGAATGASGLTGDINNAVDKQVFDTLRRLCDVVLVGAGTARAEGYGGLDKPLVLVTRHAAVPEQLRDLPPGMVQLATLAGAAQLAEARDVLGAEHVHVMGDRQVDLAALRARLGVVGLHQVLSEGGPHLLGDLLAQGVVDELDTTVVPTLLAGDHLRITSGPAVDVPLRLHTLLEHDGTLIARWLL